MTDFRFDEPSHSYYFGKRRIVGITEALTLSGLKPALDPKTRIHAANIQYAGDRGRAVHRMCELDDLGQYDDYEYDLSLAGYLEAWRAFRKDYGFTPDVVEQPLGHPVYMFGGIPDTAGPCERLGGYAVVERKQRDLEDYDIFQVEAQKILVKDVLSKPIAYGLLIRLHGDGHYRVKKCIDPKARGIFLAAVAVSNYKISKGAT